MNRDTIRETCKEDEQMQTYEGEPLNILHTIGLDILYPVVRVEMQIEPQLDLPRFKTALTAVSQIVPELLCRYEMKTNQWVQVTDDVTDLIFPAIKDVDQDAQNWDLMREPQLRVYWNDTGDATKLTLYISHILTDGAGSKQLLYLIAQAYSAGPSAVESVTNSQNLDWLETLVRDYHPAAAQQTDHPDEALKLPRLKSDGGSQYQVGRVQLATLETKRLLRATHQQHVTVNDVVMAAFGRVMQSFSGTHSIALACPTDMRQFTTCSEQTVQIANMTSRYNLSLVTELDEPFTTLVERFHQAMITRKQEMQCLDSVAGLLKQYQHEPLAKLQQIVEDNYHVREVAYTNFGVIDDQRLKFTGHHITAFVMTGGFRQAPMYQIAAGTFGNRLTLAFNMNGTQTEYTFGMALARATAELINRFALETLSE